MKKIFIFIIILLIIILASAAYLYFLQKKQTTVNQSNPAVPNSPEAPQPNTTADKITISTSQGDVTINNIEKNPVKSIAYDGSVLFRETSDYDMYFYPPDNGFVITLMNSDLEKTRSEAENDFLGALGVSKDQACELKVTLNVPFDISQKAAGKNYGLSFCPNGKPFPNN